MSGELVAITFIIGAFAMIFGIRYFSNKEKMAMIERGLDPGINKGTPKPFLSLKFGLLLLGVGLGLLIALFSIMSIFGPELSQFERNQEPAIYFGCIGIFGGLGLIVSYFVEKKWLDQQG